MSHVNISSTFSAEIVNAIRTTSLETLDEYVIDASTVVVCQPLTSRAFLRKVSPILMSKIMWNLISW